MICQWRTISCGLGGGASMGRLSPMLATSGNHKNNYLLFPEALYVGCLARLCTLDKWVDPRELGPMYRSTTTV